MAAEPRETDFYVVVGEKRGEEREKGTEREEVFLESIICPLYLVEKE